MDIVKRLVNIIYIITYILQYKGASKETVVIITKQNLLYWIRYIELSNFQFPMLVIKSEWIIILLHFGENYIKILDYNPEKFRIQILSLITSKSQFWTKSEEVELFCIWLGHIELWNLPSLKLYSILDAPYQIVENKKKCEISDP